MINSIHNIKLCSQVPAQFSVSGNTYLQTMAGPGERGMNLGISDSEYELSYICALALGSAGFLSSMEWLCIE